MLKKVEDYGNDYLKDNDNDSENNDKEVSIGSKFKFNMSNKLGKGSCGVIYKGNRNYKIFK